MSAPGPPHMNGVLAQQVQNGSLGPISVAPAPPFYPHSHSSPLFALPQMHGGMQHPGAGTHGGGMPGHSAGEHPSMQGAHTQHPMPAMPHQMPPQYQQQMPQQPPVQHQPSPPLQQPGHVQAGADVHGNLQGQLGPGAQTQSQVQQQASQQQQVAQVHGGGVPPSGRSPTPGRRSGGPLMAPGAAGAAGAQQNDVRKGGGRTGDGYADINTLVSVCNDLPEMRSAPTTPADFVYGGNCPGLQLLVHFDGKAEADSLEAFLTQINPVKTMVINKLAKVECPNPKRWNESQKVLYPCREHSAITVRVKIGPAGRRVEQAVEIVCCFSTNCKRSYWKLKSSARNWMCYFDNTELSEQCRVKCMCQPQRCSSCDEAKCAGTDAFTAKPLLKQLEWLWDRHKAANSLSDMPHADRMQAIDLAERLLERLRASAPQSALPGDRSSLGVMQRMAVPQQLQLPQVQLQQQQAQPQQQIPGGYGGVAGTGDGARGLAEEEDSKRQRL